MNHAQICHVKFFLYCSLVSASVSTVQTHEIVMHDRPKVNIILHYQLHTLITGLLLEVEEKTLFRAPIQPPFFPIVAMLLSVPSHRTCNARVGKERVQVSLQLRM